jgi:FkbM family methyltransferase
MIFKKILKTLNRRNQARKLGIHFTRASQWQLPSSVLIKNKKVEIKGPSEVGTKIAFLDIFLDDCYGLKRLRNEKIVSILDIGAHSGFFSLYARSLFSEATIHCYEPNPMLKEYVTHQASIGSIHFFPEAVGLNEGKIKIQGHEDSVQTKTVKSESGDIRMIAFKDCLQRLGGKIDILKLDCEGAEWEILKEEASVWNNVYYLCMEYHLIDGHTEEEINRVVRGLGFILLKSEKTGPAWGVIHARRK